ncbi:MAG: hypothetical protein ACP5N1_02275 [Candidatus Woesearchaeota archaeon]
MKHEQPYKNFLERLAQKHGKVYYPMITNEEELIQIIEKDFPGLAIRFDSSLNFTRDNHPEFNEHAPYTVRYMPKAVRIPKHPTNGTILDCNLIEGNIKKTLGYIRIDYEIAVWKVKHFPKKAAQLCGFDNLEHAMESLASMYGTILPPDDTLSLYQIEGYYPIKKLKK